MPRPFELNKTWIVGPSRGTTSFNAPGSITIDYGRHVAKVSGRGGSGNSPVASAWITNYNTNYNVAYPVANQPANAWTINYSPNYNVAYPIANQPEGNVTPGAPTRQVSEEADQPLDMPHKV